MEPMHNNRVTVNKRIVERALDLALEGYGPDTVLSQLRLEFADTPAHELKGAVAYAFAGTPYDLPANNTTKRQPVAADTVEKSAKKAKVMVKVNYGECSKETVAWAVTGLMHLCVREGFDFEQVLDAAIDDFQRERVGGGHV